MGRFRILFPPLIMFTVDALIGIPKLIQTRFLGTQKDERASHCMYVFFHIVKPERFTTTVDPSILVPAGEYLERRDGVVNFL